MADLASQTVRFDFYAPDAKSVLLAGEFNNWAGAANPLAKDVSGRWSTALSLPAGTYQYKFIVDGVWTNDHRPVQLVDNPFGSTNSIIRLSS